MKLSILGIPLFFAALGLTTATLGGGAVIAQQNVCQANPSPVDPSDPSIIVTSPTAGTSVTSPIPVEGQARVFEATVSIKLMDANGVLVDTTTNASEGQVLSPFSTNVAFSVTSSISACLWVFEVSAKDGSPINVVQIPLTLKPAGLPSTGMGGPSDVTRWPAKLLALVGFGLVGSALLARRLRASFH